eukprot:1161736-Pelagomonas_calceolata.AAC.10
MQPTECACPPIMLCYAMPFLISYNVDGPPSCNQDPVISSSAASCLHTYSLGGHSQSWQGNHEGTQCRGRQGSHEGARRKGQQDSHEGMRCKGRQGRHEGMRCKGWQGRHEGRHLRTKTTQRNDKIQQI